MALINHVICTHCTFGSSALEGVSGEAGGRVLGYSVRASSIKEPRSLQEEFRLVERLLSYELPADAVAADRIGLDAGVTPDRLFLMPRIGGRQVVGHVVFRPFDTAGRPGSYFAHLLVAPESPALSPLKCLQLWGLADSAGSTGWCRADREGDFPPLRGMASLDDWVGGEQSAWDAYAVEFIREGRCSAASPAPLAIPGRWQATSQSQRSMLLKKILQAMLERRETPAVVLVVEPVVAAVLFYTALRLIPEGMRADIGFSTYESDPVRAPFRLVATTFVSADTDLKPQAYQSSAFTCNTFTGPPFTRIGGDITPSEYTRWAVDSLLEDRLTSRVDPFTAAINRAWGSGRANGPAAIPTVAEMDRMTKARADVDELFRSGKEPDLAGLSDGCRRFVADRCKLHLAEKRMPSLRALSGKSQTRLLRILPQLITHKDWELLKKRDDIQAWVQESQPTDEETVAKFLNQTDAKYPDTDAIALVKKFVEENRRLPAPSEATRRLWGAAFAAAAAPAIGSPQSEYRPPKLLVDLLEQLDPSRLPSIAPAGGNPNVILGLVVGLGEKLRDKLGTQSPPIAAHLRTVLNDAAERIVDPSEFWRLLATTARCDAWEVQIPEWCERKPGPFADRITSVVAGLHDQIQKLCSEAGRPMLETLAAWTAVHEKEALSAIVQGWKSLLAWFANHGDRKKIPFVNSKQWPEDSEKGRLRLEMLDLMGRLIPGDHPTVVSKRRMTLDKMVDIFSAEGAVDKRQAKQIKDLIAVVFEEKKGR
jgi:hypothetical protein